MWSRSSSSQGVECIWWSLSLLWSCNVSYETLFTTNDMEEVFVIKLRMAVSAWFFQERKLMISVIKLGISWNGKRRLRGAFHFRPELPHFPSKSSSSRIVPKKVVVVVESIDFTWSYLSLSYTTTTATASPNFSLLLLAQARVSPVENKGIIWPHFQNQVEASTLFAFDLLFRGEYRARTGEQFTNWLLELPIL